MFDLGQIAALGVEQVNCCLGAGIERDDRTFALGRFVLNLTQCRQAGAGSGADQAGAVAVRAAARSRFKYAGAQALTAHFHQPKTGYPANLNPGAIVFERVLHRFFDLTDVGAILHVDKVDHHQSGHIAQPKLAGDFAGCFEIGVECGRFDPVFLGRTARVDVDRNQRFGRVDNDVTARLQLDFGIVHRCQLILSAIALEQGNRIGIVLYPLGVARHQQLHEVASGTIAAFAFNHDVLDFLVIDIADRAFDQVAVRMDQSRGSTAQCGLTNFVPQPGEVVEIAFDFDLGPAEPGGPDNAAHRLGQVHFGNDRFQALAVRA